MINEGKIKEINNNVNEILEVEGFSINQNEGIGFFGTMMLYIVITIVSEIIWFFIWAFTIGAQDFFAMILIFGVPVVGIISGFITSSIVKKSRVKAKEKKQTALPNKQLINPSIFKLSNMYELYKNENELLIVNSNENNNNQTGYYILKKEENNYNIYKINTPRIDFNKYTRIEKENEMEVIKIIVELIKS